MSGLPFLFFMDDIVQIDEWLDDGASALSGRGWSCVGQLPFMFLDCHSIVLFMSQKTLAYVCSFGVGVLAISTVMAVCYYAFWKRGELPSMQHIRIVAIPSAITGVEWTVFHFSWPTSGQSIGTCCIVFVPQVFFGKEETSSACMRPYPLLD